MDRYVPKIKFCGLTNSADAAAAVSAGAWALGMILWPGSPRACDPGAAAEIAAENRRKAEIVGVFVNPTLDEVAQAADMIGLSIVQLHGDEGPVFCAEVARRTGCKVIKAARIRDRADVQAVQIFRNVDFHLLDSYVPGVPGGTGATFEWELVHDHRGPVQVILSGGLTPENVDAAILTAKPWAVDVASGTELTPGVKDHRLLQAFADAVRGGSAHGEDELDVDPEAVAVVETPSEPGPGPEPEPDPLAARIAELERAARVGGSE